jgi:alpha-1,3-mannosyltransferase
MNAMPRSVTPDLPTVDIMGVDVVTATTGAAVAALDARLDIGQRIRLAFLNAHGSNLAASDPAFRTALGSFVVLNDGAGVNMAARWLHGQPFPDNLNGTDFVPRYLIDSRRTFRIYLLGAQPGVADQAAETIRRIAPRHVIAGTRHGFFTPAEAPSIASEIAGTQADLVLVAMGNPAQERFILEHFDAMACDMAIGVGALLDFMSGRVARAPELMRRLRMEWVYRLALEPRRLWRRYVLGNSKFICRLIVARMSRGS